jgi:hypothetical protein
MRVGANQDPSVTLIVEFRVRRSRRHPPHIAQVAWTALRSGAATDSWLVAVVLDPSDGGPAVRHKQMLVSHGSRSRHVVEVVIDGGDGRPTAAGYRGVASLMRRSTPDDTGSVAGFTDLGTFRFPTSRREPDVPLPAIRQPDRSR